MVLVWWVSSRDGDVSKRPWYYFVHRSSELEGSFDRPLSTLLFARQQTAARGQGKTVMPSKAKLRSVHQEYRHAEPV